MKQALSFDDVLIVPQFSTVVSRADVDPTTNFLGEEVLPIISSNMDSVTGEKMAHAIKNAGAMAALHRFQTIEENVEMYKKSPSNTMVSIGLGDAELERAAALLHAGAYKFLIDVAHGSSIGVVKQTKALRHLVKDAYIVVGNFATRQSIKDFQYNLGTTKVDAIKVGIGGGSACTTRVVTGCGLPTLHSIMDCSNVDIPIIADGGIRNSGDFAKALAAGATAVMIGKLLAGADESPTKLVTKNNKIPEISPDHPWAAPQFKQYRGSASQESYKVQGKVSTHRTPEGDSFLVPYTGPVINTIQQLEAGLRSSMSYIGATNLNQFREWSELVSITNAGIKESGAHGKT